MSHKMVSVKRCREIVARFHSSSLMVIGDAMLDEYLWGEVSRISPEAPVPIVEVSSTSLKLGGAANVASNLKAVGVKPFLVSVAGSDSNGKRLCGLIEEAGMTCKGVVASSARPTTLKTRILAQHQQVVRADHESRSPLSVKESSLLLERVRQALGKVSAVILSDYGKGILTGDTLAGILTLCKKKSLFTAVDPKKRFFEEYTGASLITPNLKEAYQAMGLPIEPYSEASVKKLGWELLDKHDLPLLLITLGEKGMALFESKGRKFSRLDTAAKKVYDVTGAGDTVISVFTAAMACGATPFEAAFLANHAAGITVGEIGTATVSPKALLDSCRS
jgi:D-glycero-beta-D-manno-heptose-7-phosphate kinase